MQFGVGVNGNRARRDLRKNAEVLVAIEGDLLEEFRESARERRC